MGFKFRKRIKICKGVNLNISNKGISTSVKVGRTTINSRGRVTHNLGHGLSYTHNLNSPKSNLQTSRSTAKYVEPQEQHENTYELAEIITTKIVGVTFECKKAPNIQRQEVLASIRKNSKVTIEPFIYIDKVGYMVVRQKDGLDLGVLPADIAEHIYDTYKERCKFEVTITETYKMEDTKSLNVCIEVYDNVIQRQLDELQEQRKQRREMREAVGERLKATTYNNEHMICSLVMSFIASLLPILIFPFSIGLWVWSKNRVSQLLNDQEAGEQFTDGISGGLALFVILLVGMTIMMILGPIASIIGTPIYYFIFRDKVNHEEIEEVEKE